MGRREIVGGLVYCAVAASLACSTLSAQRNPSSRDVAKANSLSATLGRLHADLDKQSLRAEQMPGPGAQVFRQLLREEPGEKLGKISWQLRILRGNSGNSFALPDGSVYVDNEMTRMLADNPGLWAALLSHEIAHVTGQHWAKLAALLNSLTNAGPDWTFPMRSGLPPEMILPAPSAQEAREELASFSQNLELEADAHGLELMVRAGFHPDFMPALYHLIEVREDDPTVAKDFRGTHPAWETRESKLRKRLAAAVVEFNRRWPDAANTPGGRAPFLAFAEPPEVNFSADRKSAEVDLPLRCENSSGPAKVVLLMRKLPASKVPSYGSGQLQQTIECTPSETIARFELPTTSRSEGIDGEFYVMDEHGWVLARSGTFRLEY